jgi:5-methylcytosine-specific restriction endonuclease McrA
MSANRWSGGRRWSAIRKRVLARDHYTCQACGLVDSSGRYLHVDHIVPRALGGADALDNAQTLCWQCNGIKGMSTMSAAQVGETRRRLERSGSFFRRMDTVDQARHKISPLVKVTARWR